MGLELNLQGLSGKAIVIVERAIAKADTDGDGKINFEITEEVTVFAEELKKQHKNGNLTTQEYIQLQRPINTDKVEETETAEVTKKDKRQAKKDEKRAENIYLRYIDELANGGVTRENLLESLDERAGSQKDDQRYIELRAAVTDVLDALNKVDSKTPLEVDQNHDDVKKALDAAGKNDKLHRTILRDVEKMIKTEMKQAAYNEITAIYADIVAQDKANGIEKRTDEEIMADVKARLEQDEKYANGTHERDYQNPYVDAFKSYENDKVMAEARKTMSAAIYEQIDSTEWREVRSDAKKALEDSGVLDKYVKKAFRQDFGDSISGEKRLSRIIAENQARENNVDFHSIQSKDEILEALGSKKEVFEALVSQGLITEREDGYYDLSKLQEVLLVQVGADYKQARDAKEDEAISEKLRTLGKLSVDTKLSTLTHKEAKELLLLAGFDIEQKDWTRVILKTILGGAVGVLAGGGVEATRPRQSATVRVEDVLPNDITLVINVDVNNKVNVEHMFGSVPSVNDTTVIVSLKDILSKLGTRDIAVDFMRAVPMTALKHGLIGAAFSCASALSKDTPAVPVTVTQFQETDINKYLERVAKETPAYLPVLTSLALTYVKEDGTWDAENYKLYLDRIAGSGHKLERDELVQALKDLNEEVVEDTTTENKIENPVTPPPAQEDVIANGEVEEVKTREAEIPTIDGGKTSWPKLAESYNCLVETYGLKKAIRMLKIAQAITDGNYTEERMLELYELSVKGGLKNVEGVDYDIYYGALMGTALSRHKYDEDGNIIPGTGVKVPAMLAGCKRDVNMDTSDKYTGKGPDRYVAPKGHAADTVKEYYSKTSYGIRINNGNIEIYDNKAASDARFKEARDQYPNAKVEKLDPEDIKAAIR